MSNDSRILDFSSPQVKKMTLAWLKTLTGLYWFECRRAREQRSLQQNSYLWGVVYPDVRDGMIEAWGETLSTDEVHEFLKDKFLAKPVINRATGEAMGKTTPSTTKLNTKECAEYIDQITKFAAEYLGVQVRPAMHNTGD